MKSTWHIGKTPFHEMNSIARVQNMLKWEAMDYRKKMHRSEVKTLIGRW